MKTIKEKDYFVIGVIAGALLFVVLQYVLVHFIFPEKVQNPDPLFGIA